MYKVEQLSRLNTTLKHLICLMPVGSKENMTMVSNKIKGFLNCSKNQT